MAFVLTSSVFANGQPIADEHARDGGNLSQNGRSSKMADDKKDNKVDPGTKQDSQGEHGGNRGGDHGRDPDEPGKSSRAAGKDPHRGEE